MTALTLRLPEDKHRRLKALAQQRGVSINRLLDEAATLLLVEFNAETRFQLRAERGQGRGVERGLALLRQARESEPLNATVPVGLGKGTEVKGGYGGREGNE